MLTSLGVFAALILALAIILLCTRYSAVDPKSAFGISLFFAILLLVLVWCLTSTQTPIIATTFALVLIFAIGDWHPKPPSDRPQ